jgi:hypothetical protein
VVVDFGVCSLEVLEENIVKIVLKKEQEIGADVARKMFEYLQEIDLRFFKLMVIVEEDVQILPSAREWMSDPSRVSRSSADAFVVDSLPKRLIINFYIKHNKPSVPSRSFSSEEKALKWLRSKNL